MIETRFFVPKDLEREKKNLPSKMGFALKLLFFIGFGFTSPLYGQGFDALLKELSGSDADQLDSDMESSQKRDKVHPLHTSTEMISNPDEDEFSPQKNIKTNGVSLQGLDKLTARVFIIEAKVGQTVEFGTLKIVIQHCEKAPLEDRQESMAFVTITETKQNCPTQKLFSGWMFASSPALSFLDHPTYDVWIKECKDL